ncbi:ATP-binding protein [Sulfurimonas sp. HSL1-6]|uniref:ATP-binding protein n=1 Tax=Sulfurimonadaceae TaxID=2771471 RepID=UPI0031F79DEA
MGIGIDNIEHHLHLFQGQNTSFPFQGWCEPIYAAMIRAYQNDNGLTVTIGNDYIKNMITGEYRTNATYSPIETIIGRAGIEKISLHTTDIMLKNFPSLKPEDKKDLKDYLQYLFIELMNNVADHAHSAVGGYTMAQYFPSGRHIQFVVADRGVGFLENMRLNYDDVSSELDAIVRAFNKGVTSTRQTMYGAAKNAGFGLYAMLQIMLETGGKFVVISNGAMMRYNGEFDMIDLDVPWKGVIVAFEFDEAKINHDMDYFRNTYLWGEDLGEDEDFYS